MTRGKITISDKLGALRRVTRYRPKFVVFIIFFSALAALLEGIGLSFLLPVIEAAQSDGPLEGGDGIVGMFFTVYETVGIPFTLEYMLAGIALVMTVRYGATFTSSWLAAKLHMGYEGHLKDEAFTRALETDIAYYDREGSDDILNALVTQTRFAGKVIKRIVKFCQQSLLVLVYLSIAVYLAPVLTLLAVLSLGGVTYLIRNIIEPGYTVGDRVAEANESIQHNVQAGTQGIRDVKLFQMESELLSKFRTYVDQYVTSNVSLHRNKSAIKNLYELSVSMLMFVLIYVAIEMLALSLGALGVFLFAMFRLAPRVSTLNSKFYAIEGELPHLVRTHWFVDELQRNEDGTEVSEEIPDQIEHVEFKDVTFSYESSEEQVLKQVSFGVDRGDFVAFVGQSGAGKSTLLALLARLYDLDEGEITANGVPIRQFDETAWRRKLAMVRQDPHIFNDTLRFNLTIGNRNASQAEIDRVARISRIDEFVDDLPNGYETTLGDEGVQLSGGQRQRVSLARALLTDAKILILDEATSDLDSNLERDIHNAVEQLDDKYTVFAVAHRLSTVHNADQIYTMENGEIVEAGTHEELVERDGRYAQLHAIQT